MWRTLVAGRGQAARGMIVPGEGATLALPLASDRVLTLSCNGHHRIYALTVDVPGFDTVHVRAADPRPVAAR